MIKPTKSNLIVRIDPRESVTDGGIIVGTGVERERILYGTVEAVGPDCESRVGNRVLLDRAACRLDISEPGGPELVIVDETRHIEAIL